MECDSSFSTDFMLLEPEKVRFVDLFHMLFSSDLKKRKFIDCPKGSREESFNRRWIMFMSVLVQKILLSSAKPMARFGSSLEHWMNLVACNRSVSRLFLNYIRGNVARPDETSADYVSFTGQFDKRVDFGGITTEDSRYYGELSIMAAKISYENKAYVETVVNDKWKMKFLNFYDFYNEYQKKNTTQACLFQDKETNPNLVVVAFRGTEPFDADAWSSDFDLSWYQLPNVGKVHGGFMKALGLQKCEGWPEKIEPRSEDRQIAYYTLRDRLKEIMDANPNTKFLVTGHSLGGALAILFPAILTFHNEVELLNRLEGIYTFGQPRVGDGEFVKYMQDKFDTYNVRYYRTVYSNDLVPRLPYDDKSFTFKHFGKCVYFDSFYKGKIVDEEPNKNYFSPFSAIPKLINAVWELTRSFVIRYTRGREYKEGTLLRVFRVIGLIVAGVPAHCTHDYVNAIRLGGANLYKDQPTILVKNKEN